MFLVSWFIYIRVHHCNLLQTILIFLDKFKNVSENKCLMLKEKVNIEKYENKNFSVCLKQISSKNKEDFTSLKVIYLKIGRKMEIKKEKGSSHCIQWKNRTGIQWNNIWMDGQILLKLMYTYYWYVQILICIHTVKTNIANIFYVQSV